ncbi:MAG TPA: hypothetical protein VK473_00625 [Terriglobales bacterium]|nr:hypothetical protein [Terriglobales bacterium]
MTTRSVLAVVLAFSVAAAAQSLHSAARINLPSASTRLQFSPSGEQIAVAGADHRLRLVKLPSGEIEHVFEAQDIQGTSALAYSPDGRWIALGKGAGAVILVDASTGSALKQWSAGDREVETLLFSHDGRKLVVGMSDRPGQLWEVSGEPRLRFTTHAQFAGLSSAAFSPDDRWLLSADEDTIVRIYDVSTGKEQASNHDLLLESFGTVFTRDGKQALVGGADYAILFVDPASGQTTRRLGAQPGVIGSLAAAPDGKHILATYFDATGLTKPMPILLLDLATGKSQVVSDGRSVIGCGIAKDRIWLATAQDQTLELWRWE